MEAKETLELLRKESKKRKFDQTVDLVINLRKIDLKRENIAIVATLPHKFKDKKVCGFLTKKNDIVRTITKPEFQKFSEKNMLKELVEEYDYFIAHASLMPAVATSFGKVLGPAGKMPSPQLGVITEETPEVIKPLLEKIAKSVKIRAKEASIKIAVGKESMKDEEIIDNIYAVYNEVVNILPNKKENVKNILIKFTMTKPVKMEFK